MIGRVAAAVLASASVVTFEPMAPLDPDVRSVLMHDLRFTAPEIVDLQHGKIVRHVIPTTTPGEIAVVGGARVRAAKSVFLDAVRDIERFKKSPDVLEIGRFSRPPVAHDLDRLTVTAEDFDVRHCRVGDCPIRLPADVIQHVVREADVQAPGALVRGAYLFKQLLFDDVHAYWTGGPGRMAQYDDGDTPVRPIDEFVGVLNNSPSLDTLVPGLSAHLKNFPVDRLTSADDFLYWSKEKFGPEPFITVTQVTIVCPSERTCAIVSKDVYSSRYFDASLAVTIVSDDGPAGILVVYANRSRANALKGSFAGLRRSIVERRARGGLEENLKALRQRLEALK
jgi:hypothetical protein